MFDASLPELVLVFVIALLVLGPQRLPKVAAELGKWVGRARRTATQLRRQLEREIELSEIQPPTAPQARTGTGVSSSLSPSAREMSDALADSAAGRTVSTAPAPGAAASARHSTDAPTLAPASSDAPLSREATTPVSSSHAGATSDSEEGADGSPGKPPPA